MQSTTRNDSPVRQKHAVVFMLYGSAVGALYASILFVVLRGLPLVAGVCGLSLVALLGYLGWGLSREHTTPVWRRLATIPFIPIVLPAALIGIFVFLLMMGCVSIWMMPKQIWQERKLRRFLRERGRLIEMTELESRLRAGEGTLLEECGPKGACRIWWTNDDLASQEPPLEADERFIALLTRDDNSSYDAAREFNTLCLTEYVGRDCGKASLTTIPPRHARSGKLACRFPKAKRVIVVPPPSWWRENRVV